MKRKGIKWLSRIAHRIAMKSRTQTQHYGDLYRHMREARKIVRDLRARLAR